MAFRTNQRFNLEVTRLRTLADADASGAEAPGVGRLANVIAGKLRQLPGDIPNALILAARGLDVSEDSLAAAVRLLKAHTDIKDDAFFARRGFSAVSFTGEFVSLRPPPVLVQAPRRSGVPSGSRLIVAGLAGVFAAVVLALLRTVVWLALASVGT